MQNTIDHDKLTESFCAIEHLLQELEIECSVEEMSDGNILVHMFELRELSWFVASTCDMTMLYHLRPDNFQLNYVHWPLKKSMNLYDEAVLGPTSKYDNYLSIDICTNVLSYDRIELLKKFLIEIKWKI